MEDFSSVEGGGLDPRAPTPPPSASAVMHIAIPGGDSYPASRRSSRERTTIIDVDDDNFSPKQPSSGSHRSSKSTTPCASPEPDFPRRLSSAILDEEGGSGGGSNSALPLGPLFTNPLRQQRHRRGSAYSVGSAGDSGDALQAKNHSIGGSPSPMGMLVPDEASALLLPPGGFAFPSHSSSVTPVTSSNASFAQDPELHVDMRTVLAFDSTQATPVALAHRPTRSSSASPSTASKVDDCDPLTASISPTHHSTTHPQQQEDRNTNT